MAWFPRGAVSALVFLCAGCSSLIGLDEFRDAPEGAGGAAGAGGSGAQGGSAAQGGSGSTSGTGAQGGNGNASGDGGSGGSGGVVTACSGQPDGQTCTLEGADAGADADAGPDADAGTDAGDAGASERRICLNQQCVVSRCGDGYADDGRGEACDDQKNGNQTDGCRDDCQYTCATNEDCVAGLLCVVSQCNQTTHTCGPQSPDTCDDSDPCTADSCNTGNGACSNSLIDNDGDGFSAFTCNPSGAHPDQGGDCVDSATTTGSASIFPGATTFYPTPHNIPGLKPFDYNCDGLEEREFPHSHSQATCTSGWKSLVGVPIPACGESGDWYVYFMVGSECQFYPPVRTVVQACR